MPSEYDYTPVVGDLIEMLQHQRGANARATDLACPHLDELQCVRDRRPAHGNDRVGRARRSALKDGIAILNETEELRNALLVNFGLLQNSTAPPSERNKAARAKANMSYDQWDKDATRGGRWTKCRRTLLLEDLEACLESLPRPDELRDAPAVADDLTRHLDQLDFYRELTDAVRLASIRLDLTHHEAMPPSLTGIGVKREYFEVMEAKTLAAEIPIRRIVAIPTIEKLEWVEGYMLERFADVPVFHLRYSTFHHEIPAPLSLQLVDDIYAFMINIGPGSHTETGDDIDLLVHNAIIARYLRQYYEAYWDSCMSIKEGRRINEEGLRDLRRHLENEDRDAPA